MNAGREIFGGSMAAATRDPMVIQVYLGGAHA
jgi:ABC-type branched-subunit amino acid transport system ATPase component